MFHIDRKTVKIRHGIRRCKKDERHTKPLGQPGKACRVERFQVRIRPMKIPESAFRPRK